MNEMKKNSFFILLFGSIFFLLLVFPGSVKAKNIYTLKTSLKQDVILMCPGDTSQPLFDVYKNGKLHIHTEFGNGIKYKSTDTSIIDIADKELGRLYAKKSGTAYVICKYKNARLKLKIVVQDVIITCSGKCVDDTVYIPKGYSVSYFPSAKNNVKITSTVKDMSIVRIVDGNLCGIDSGTTTVTARCKYGNATLNVVVLPEPDITISNMKYIKVKGKPALSVNITNNTSSKAKLKSKALLGGFYSVNKYTLAEGTILIKPGHTEALTLTGKQLNAMYRSFKENDPFGQIGFRVNVNGYNYELYYNNAMDMTGCFCLDSYEYVIL